MARKAARIKAPDAKIGASGFTFPAWTATIGAHRPVILFKQDAIPVPVPRLGAGKTSGVYAYKTPYMMSISMSVHATRERCDWILKRTLKESFETAHGELEIGR